VTAVQVYRMALRLLPAELQRKHGDAMVALFTRELEAAGAQGQWSVAFTVARALWDVAARAAYEQVLSVSAAMDPRQDARAQRTIHERGLPSAGADTGETHRHTPQAPLPTARQHLSGHARSFAIAFVSFTSLLLMRFAANILATLRESGASNGQVIEVLLLAGPFVAALTIPMSVLVAVLHQFTRLGSNGTLTVARHTRHGVRRLVLPVLAAAAGMSVLAFVITAELVPRTNVRLFMYLSQDRSTPNDRTMTIAALRAAARNVPSGAGRIARVAAFEVEAQKKLAIPAACIVLALAGMAIAFRIPRGGAWLAVGASVVVLAANYVLLMTGEALADQQVLSPIVAMWGANAVLITLAALLTWQRPSRNLPSSRAPVVVG